MTSYLHENEAENLQNGDVHLAQIPDISRTILSIEVSDGLFLECFTLFQLSLTYFSNGVSL